MRLLRKRSPEMKPMCNKEKCTKSVCVTQTQRRSVYLHRRLIAHQTFVAFAFPPLPGVDFAFPPAVVVATSPLFSSPSCV